MGTAEGNRLGDVKGVEIRKRHMAKRSRAPRVQIRVPGAVIFL
jgi:hypothetical protein